MNELQKLMDEVGSWSDDAFGSGQRSLAILHHLAKEIPELLDAIGDYDRGANDTRVNVSEMMELHRKMRFEFADAFMLLLDAARKRGFMAEDLIQVTRLKLEVNRRRKWGKPDENGIIEHLRES